MVDLNINPDEVPPDQYDLLPAGEYPAFIESSELKQSDTSATQQLILTWKVFEGPFTGRKIFDRQTRINRDGARNEIFPKTMVRIAKAVGHAGIIANSEVLHNKPAVLKLKVKPAEGKYNESNEVTSYRPYVQGQAIAAPAQANPAQTQAPAAAKRNPWD